MSSKSKRLGSLADVFQSEKLEGTIRKIRLDRIAPSTIQPRTDRKKGVEELASSLKAEGLLQPIVVTKSENEELYKIIAGERRFHAAKMLSWTEIECKILDRNEKETYRLAIIENLQRENLSAYDEIDAISHLKSLYGYTDSDLGSIFGKSRNYVSELLGIAGLSKRELELCKSAQINSKNLLIQAAHAAKNGGFPDFINLYTKGELKTVKDAKEFNKISGRSDKKKQSSPDIKKHTGNFELSKKGDTIFIRSQDPALLNDIYRIVKKELNKT